MENWKLEEMENWKLEELTCEELEGFDVNFSWCGFIACGGSIVVPIGK